LVFLLNVIDKLFNEDKILLPYIAEFNKYTDSFYTLLTELYDNSINKNNKNKTVNIKKNIDDLLENIQKLLIENKGSIRQINRKHFIEICVIFGFQYKYVNQTNSINNNPNMQIINKLTS
jgi:hypothetical protein